MGVLRVLPLLALATSCRDPQPQTVETTRQPAPNRPVTDRCERFLAHSARLTGFSGAHGAGDRQFCESLTTEQQECGLAARTEQALSLCIQFADPRRRATAQLLAPSVRSSWPGSHPVLAVLGGTVGCGFGGLMGVQGVPIEELEAVAMFAVRETDHAGDPENVLAWLVRGGPTQPWTCARTDPPDRCASLQRACQP